MNVNSVVFAVLSFTALTVSAADIQWLRDDSRSSPKVLEHLKQQNQISEEYLKGLRTLSGSFTDEWLEQAPNKAEKPWLIRKRRGYRIQHLDGREVLIERKADGSTRVLLDIDGRRQAHDYYRLGRWSLSADGNQLALAEDIQGNEAYRVVVKNLKSGKEIELAQQMDSYLLWSKQQDALFVIGLESGTFRSHKLIKLPIEQGAESQLLWEEKDPHFLLSAYTGSRGDVGIIQSNSEKATVQRVLDLTSHELSSPLRPRQDGLEYYADSTGETLVINSNHEGGFQLYRRDPGEGQWQFLYSPGQRQISDFHLFRSAIVVIERQGHESHLVVLDYQGKVRRDFPLGAEASVAWVSRNGDFLSDKVRVRSMSMVTPPTWSELDLSRLEWTELAQDDYPGFQPDHYRTERLWVKNGDVKVPVTLAYRKDKLAKNSPVVLYGYGAYGVTMRPYFMSQVVSLMDRGAIYAVAHVRGGGYFGEPWHQQGKGVLKGNGINDYLAAARALKVFASGERPILAIGGSAGGTLVAAALNRAPTLFKAAVLQVPFVDVVASMSDNSLPLTMQQYGEWGNPNVPEQLEAMKSYDPVLNIQDQAYPPILVQVGLHDQRVPYWEGAKYQLSMKAHSSAPGPYLLRTDFAAGHDADRRNGLLRQAQEYAFLLSQVNSSDSEQ